MWCKCPRYLLLGIFSSSRPVLGSPSLQMQRDCTAILQPYFAPDGLINKCLEFGRGLDHVMDYTRLRALGTLFSMMNQAIRNVISYNNNHQDFPMSVSDPRNNLLVA